jgi:N-acetylmuramoyl-L-alanine amidase
VNALGTHNRGVKTESASQHARLAVLNFPRAVLIELGFIDHAGDRALLLDPKKMLQACDALCHAITGTNS